MKEDNIKINEVLNILKKKIKLILTITISFTILIALVTIYAIKPKYEGSTKLFVGKDIIDRDQSVNDLNYNNNDIQMYEKIIQTYADIIHTKSLVKKSFVNNKIHEDIDETLNHMVVTPIINTQLIEIKYIDKDPKKAEAILKAISSEFMDYSINLIPNANVEMVEEVNVPSNPVSPNALVNSIIGFLIALLGSSTVICLVYFMNRTYSDKKDIEQEIGIPVIGDIPKMEV